MSLSSKDYFRPGVKVRFLYERDADMWRVNDLPGIITSTREYGPCEKMMIIKFDNVFVTASSSQFRIVEDE